MARNFGLPQRDEPKSSERGYSSPDAYQSWTGYDGPDVELSPSWPMWVVGISIAAALIGGAVFLG